jgi:hypothetical protein
LSSGKNGLQTLRNGHEKIKTFVQTVRSVERLQERTRTFMLQKLKDQLYLYASPEYLKKTLKSLNLIKRNQKHILEYSKNNENVTCLRFLRKKKLTITYDNLRNLRKLTETYGNLRKLTETYENLRKLTKTYDTYGNLRKLTKTYENLRMTYGNLRKLTKIKIFIF